MEDADYRNRRKNNHFIKKDKNFLTNVAGQVCIIIYPRKNGDRWWNSDDLVNQVVEHAIPIFETRFPDAKALFVFDNATSHAVYADNTLVANNMNLSLGRKQAKMRNNIKQNICFSMDYKIPELCEEPKGLREILKERKLWHDGMKLKYKGGCEEGSINCYTRTVMANQPDFKA
ncbi:15488_t:CDS:2 [Dentiscutata heterogama]|uniref:15488_t:CDS:1 n=1 Tax=Dentiscutata heterogama TaxID=1316150 RepID=A0ACA9MGH4_9GLOM|nr:15488_t:CDS:2 [Dentiscutata heterogama]